MNLCLNTAVPFYQNTDINSKKNNVKNVCSEKCNTNGVSFGAMKKSQFSDIDLIVVNKFNVPISGKNFNTNDDLQNWCYDKMNNEYEIEKLSQANDLTISRDEILKEWAYYCIIENDECNNAASLLVIDSVATPRTDVTKLPPVLIKSVVDKTINQIKENAAQNRNYQVNFNNLYQNNLYEYYLEDLADNDYTGWVTIPSKENDFENFDDNVDKLKALSGKTWCTKSYNASAHLSKGDFHIYFDKKRPKIGLRFAEGKIQEIQGENNDGKIPVNYLDITKKHIKNYKINDKTASQILEAENIKYKLDELQRTLGKPIENASNEELFKAVDMFEKCDEDGKIILKFYSTPDTYIKWSDIGVNEDNLLNDVKEIQGDAYFFKSNVKKLDNLKKIGGDAYFSKDGIEVPGGLEVKGRIIKV